MLKAGTSDVFAAAANEAVDGVSQGTLECGILILIMAEILRVYVWACNGGVLYVVAAW